ncbi:hypothetical protein XM25_04595 [Devosia sp. H5989]|nr:hypothetical protein XM25_04595 [Devosia sp. H5989]
MKYLCIVYSDHDSEAPESPDSVSVKDACIEQDLALFNAGKLHMASPLKGPETSVVLKARDGRVLRTDGPFIETKEWIAGFMVIEAKDLDEAIDLAMSGPPVGILELRPILDEQHSKTGQDRSIFFNRDDQP